MMMSIVVIAVKHKNTHDKFNKKAVSMDGFCVIDRY